MARRRRLARDAAWSRFICCLSIGARHFSEGILVCSSCGAGRCGRARCCSRRGAGEAAIGLALGLYSEQAFSAVFGATLRRWLRTQRGDDANARDRRGEDVGERVGRWRCGRGSPETQPASTNEKGASGFPEAPFLHPW